MWMRKSPGATFTVRSTCLAEGERLKFQQRGGRRRTRGEKERNRGKGRWLVKAKEAESLYSSLSIEEGELLLKYREERRGSRM